MVSLEPGVGQPPGQTGTKPRRRLLVPRFIAAEVVLWRELGLRGYIRKRGFWLFAAVFVFYLVRDSILYILIPYLVIQGVIQCPGPGSP